MTKQISYLKSPVGNLQIEEEDELISTILFMDSSKVPSFNSKYSSIMKKCRKELQEYFEGSRKSFTVEIKPTGTDFEKLVWNELKRIPFGSTISYEELAVNLGDVKKIRAAARANGKNPLPILIPCHRVIGKDGNLVGFAGGLQRKEWLLSHEGAIGKQVSIFSKF